MPGTTCFALHSLENATIHQVCLFLASVSQGEVHTSAAVWPSSSSNFLPLFTFPRSVPEVLPDQRDATKAVLQHLCAGWISTFPPKKRLLGELGQLHKAAAAQESWCQGDEARAALAKLIRRQRCLSQRPCQVTLYGAVHGSCWAVTHISHLFTAKAKWLPALCEAAELELPLHSWPCAGSSS